MSRVEVNGVEFSEADVLACRRRPNKYVRAREDLLDLGNRLARAMGMPESDEDLTFPEMSR